MAARKPKVTEGSNGTTVWCEVGLPKLTIAFHNAVFTIGGQTQVQEGEMVEQTLERLRSSLVDYWLGEADNQFDKLFTFAFAKEKKLKQASR